MDNDQMNSGNRPGLVAADAVARFLSISTATVYRLAQAGAIPCVRVGKLIRFDLPEVEQHLLSAQQEEADKPVVEAEEG